MRDKGQQCWGDVFAFLLLLSNRLNCLLDLTCIIKIWVVFKLVII